MRRFLWVILLCAAIAGAWYCYSSRNDTSDGSGQSAGPASGGSGSGGSGKHGGSKNPSVPVSVATAAGKDIPVFLQGLGNVTPRTTVTIHTLINGELMRLLFTEGQLVKKDDMLALIDDRPYTAALLQAEGFLTRDQALLTEARLDLERYQTLWKQDSIARQQLDLQSSLVKQYEGTVENDKGQVDAAKTNLIYTKITSPVTGRVGLRQVDQGNIVHTTDTNGIVVVTELQPITAIFTIPEDDISKVFQHTSNGEKLVTEAWDRDNKNKLQTGSLSAVDNVVDPTTGMVRFRAEFANEDNSLFPSQFVNIRLQLDTLKNAVTIPGSGVQRGTNGTFAYVVNPDKTVTVQTITIGPADGDTVSVTKGLAIGDQVVVDGADSLRDGAKIDIASADGKPVGKSGAAKDGQDKDAKAGDAGDKSAGDNAPGDKKQHKHKKHTGDDSQ